MPLPPLPLPLLSLAGATAAAATFAAHGSSPYTSAQTCRNLVSSAARGTAAAVAAAADPAPAALAAVSIWARKDAVHLLYSQHVAAAPLVSLVAGVVVVFAAFALRVVLVFLFLGSLGMKGAHRASAAASTTARMSATLNRPGPAADPSTVLGLARWRGDGRLSFRRATLKLFARPAGAIRYPPTASPLKCRFVCRVHTNTSRWLSSTSSHACSTRLSAPLAPAATQVKTPRTALGTKRLSPPPRPRATRCSHSADVSLASVARSRPPKADTNCRRPPMSSR